MLAINHFLMYLGTNITGYFLSIALIFLMVGVPFYLILDVLLKLDIVVKNVKQTAKRFFSLEGLICNFLAAVTIAVLYLGFTNAYLTHLSQPFSDKFLEVIGATLVVFTIHQITTTEEKKRNNFGFLITSSVKIGIGLAISALRAEPEALQTYLFFITLISIWYLFLFKTILKELTGSRRLNPR